MYDGQGFWLCSQATFRGPVSLVAGRRRPARQSPGRPSAAGVAVCGRSRGHESRALLASRGTRLIFRRSHAPAHSVQARLASIGRFLIHPVPPAAREFLPPAERLFLCDAGCPMRRPPPEILEMNDQKRQELLRRVEQAGLEEGDLKLIRALFESYAYITELIDDKNTSITRLRKLLFGARTEKTANVIGRDQPVPAASTEPARPWLPRRAGGTENRPRPQRGRQLSGCEPDQGSSRVAPARRSLPGLRTGNGLRHEPPGVLIRFVGQPPVTAAIYELEKLRCNLCGRDLHGAGAGGGRRRREVRRHSRQHGGPAQVRDRPTLPSSGQAAEEPGNSAASLDAMGHRLGRGPGR